MKIRKNHRYVTFLIYTLFIILICIGLRYLNLDDEFINYINFDTTNVKFQDLLSIMLTILSIFVGAIITVATVLISMCDKRIMRLIREYGLYSNVIDSIKIAISTGILTVILLAIIYSNLVFDIKVIRYIVLYISGITLITFIKNSKILIVLIINILDNAFESESSLIEKTEFINPKK